MPYFSEKLDIYDNYTRGELCDLLNIDFGEHIEGGVFHPLGYSSIFLFSTIHNNAGYTNGKLSDTEYFHSSNHHFLNTDIIQHQITGKELLLFVRIDQETGFYYFGKCNYQHPYELINYQFPLYLLKLEDGNHFSKVKNIEIPNLLA